MNAKPASIIYWVLKWQGILVSAVSFGYVLTGSGLNVLGVLAGGVIGMLLTFQFGVRVLLKGKQEPSEIVSAFYKAEAFKFLTAVLFFGIAAGFFPEYFLQIVAGYSLTIVPYWLSLRWKKPE